LPLKGVVGTPLTRSVYQVFSMQCIGTAFMFLGSFLPLAYCAQQGLPFKEGLTDDISLQLLQKRVSVYTNFTVQKPGSSFNKGNVKSYCPEHALGTPSVCQKDTMLWSKQQLRDALPEFAKVYRTRPIGIDYRASPNHAFALWFTVKQLKPKYIIESGVGKGGSTWMLRQAAGELTKIIALDPAPAFDVEYKDAGNTVYLLDRTFQDLGNIDWNVYIPPSDRENTLVMLDDHISAAERVRHLIKSNFTHLWFGPNYHYGEPGQDVYSFNFMCSKLAETVSSKAGLLSFNERSGKKEMSLQQHRQYQTDMLRLLDTYYEFPAIWNGACTDPDELLGQDELVKYGLPEPAEAKYHYYTSHPPYVKLRPQAKPAVTSAALFKTERTDRTDRTERAEQTEPTERTDLKETSLSCPPEFLVSPYHCPMGSSFASADQLRSVVPEFAKLLSAAPSDMASMNMNEAFSLWYTIRELKPRYIIESGASEGWRTWIMRQTAPVTTLIVVLDPRSKKLLKWTDDTGSTKYLMEWDFQDISEVDWSQHIPEVERSHTLAVLNDHHQAYGRLQTLQSLSITHVWFGSNPTYSAPQDAYSMNMICSLLAESASHNQATVKFTNLYRSTQLTLGMHTLIQRDVAQSLETYYEIPPLWDEECSFSGQLYTNSSVLSQMGIPTSTKGQFHNGRFPYVQLKPNQRVSLAVDA